MRVKHDRPGPFGTAGGLLNPICTDRIELTTAEVKVLRRAAEILDAIVAATSEDDPDAEEEVGDAALFAAGNLARLIDQLDNRLHWQQWHLPLPDRHAVNA